MITREDLNSKNSQEIQDMLQADIQKYVVELESIESEEELLQREQEIMKFMNENDARMKDVKYALPSECTFDKQCFSKEKVSEFIVDILEKQEVEWSYTLGLYEMVRLWKDKNLKEIQYHAYDSVLRLLGGVKYKGFQEWKKILVVNEFLVHCHEEYVRDYGYIIYLSQLHNAILEGLKKLNGEVEPETTSEQ